jgi:2-oxoglutarate ferredoxin oxidoreductase subunit gamma
MIETIFIAGFGGQGVLLAGKLVCLAAMTEGKHVSHIPSYGAEMRGGTANCSVVVSDEEIASPLVPHPAVLIALNTPSLAKFEPLVRQGGLVIWNRSLCTPPIERAGVAYLGVPANELAEEVGSYKAANMVALGALIARRPAVAGLADVEAALEEAVSARHRELNAVNRKALKKGYEAAA